MSIRKVKMATAMLILFNAPKPGNLIDMLQKPWNWHSQKLCTVLGQKYHLEWYFLTRPIRTILLLKVVIPLAQVHMYLR
jgi:hypothetical protein